MISTEAGLLWSRAAAQRGPRCAGSQRPASCSRAPATAGSRGQGTIQKKHEKAAKWKQFSKIFQTFWNRLEYYKIVDDWTGYDDMLVIAGPSNSFQSGGTQSSEEPRCIFRS